MSALIVVVLLWGCVLSATAYLPTIAAWVINLSYAGGVVALTVKKKSAQAAEVEGDSDEARALSMVGRQKAATQDTEDPEECF